jgi:hypothetical protein
MHHFVLAIVDQGAIGIGRGVVWVALDRCVEVGKGAVEVALVVAGLAAIAVGQRPRLKL